MESATRRCGPRNLPQGFVPTRRAFRKLRTVLTGIPAAVKARSMSDSEMQEPATMVRRSWGSTWAASRIKIVTLYPVFFLRDCLFDGLNGVYLARGHICMRGRLCALLLLGLRCALWRRVESLNQSKNE